MYVARYVMNWGINAVHLKSAQCLNPKHSDKVNNVADVPRNRLFFSKASDFLFKNFLFKIVLLGRLQKITSVIIFQVFAATIRIFHS